MTWIFFLDAVNESYQNYEESNRAPAPMKLVLMVYLRGEPKLRG
jgi:hypothetical protein